MASLTEDFIALILNIKSYPTDTTTYDNPDNMVMASLKNQFKKNSGPHERAGKFMVGDINNDY